MMSNRFATPIRHLLVAAALWVVPAMAHGQVIDNAHIFTPDATRSAESAMKGLNDQYGKQLVVETFADVRPDQQSALQQDKAKFFHDWMAAEALANRTDGVFVLICMNPGHVEVGSGKETREKGIFAIGDDRRLEAELLPLLNAKQYDTALSTATRSVGRTYTANVPSASTPRSSPAAAAPAARGSSDAAPTPSRSTDPATPATSHRLGCGSILCLGVAFIIVVAVVRSFLRRSGRGGPPAAGGGFGGGGGPNYPTGGPGVGGPNYQQNYGGGGMVGGGGTAGGGFGRGLLGGLLGGAVGGYAADKFEHRNDPAAGGGGVGASGGSAGGGFDSGPSDAGQGFGGASAGGDFGGGSSGADSSGGDFGGGGGDAGGGGGGGDSGGGGGDAGGGF